MNAYDLPYLSLFRGCIILRCVTSFKFFILIVSRQCCIHLGKWEEITKSSLQTNYKLTHGYIHLDLAKVQYLKELTSPYWPLVIELTFPYIHFLNLNNILTLPKLSPSLNLGFIWYGLCLPCFLPARFTCMRVSLRNENKSKPSIEALLLISCKPCCISSSSYWML